MTEDVSYYENFKEIEKKIWSLLNNAVKDRTSEFRTPVFICGNEKDLDGRPEINNLLNIFMAIEDVSLSNLIQRYAGMEFKKFKEDLADCLVSKLSKISSEMRKLLSDNQYLDSILSEGSMNAQEIAKKNILDIKKLIGFYKS